jgi:hypothetical protein
MCRARRTSRQRPGRGEGRRPRDHHGPLGGSGVFDYSYFINHWGWFYGNNIIANGSVRSNGQFDFGGYASSINGSPRYQSSNGYQLVGYMDDNNDGVKDGTDGGAYSGMAIVNEANIKGMGALAKNQHEYQDSVPMPNLSDLTYYEAKAKAKGASIQLGGSTIVAGVLGDDTGEKKNLFRRGHGGGRSSEGPVVVRGNAHLRRREGTGIDLREREHLRSNSLMCEPADDTTARQGDRRGRGLEAGRVDP